MKTPLDHAREWDAIADAEERMGEIAAAAGNDISANRERVKIYRRTAESFRLEAKTGEPHCSCCLKPFAKHGA